MAILIKSTNHDHFWIEGGLIFETYKTIRGLRWRPLYEVLYPDVEKLTEEQIEAINDQLKEQ